MFCVGTDFAVAIAAALFEMLRARLVDTCDRGAFLQLLCVGPRHLAADIDLGAAALLVQLLRSFLAAAAPGCGWLQHTFPALVMPRVSRCISWCFGVG